MKKVISAKKVIIAKYVRNASGTGERECSCGSWIKHWENFSGIKVRTCRRKGCSGNDLDGAHVKLWNGDNNKEYIVPLCCGCNQIAVGEKIELKEGTLLVRANKSETCEKASK